MTSCPTVPSFSMTLTIDLESVLFTDYMVQSVSYQEKDWWGPAHESFFCYDNDNRVYSTSEFSGLKLAIFSHFPEVLVTYKRHTALYIGLFSLQNCPDLMGGGQ